MDAIKEYFNNLESREKNLVITAAVLIGLLIPYQFMWKPFSESLENSQIRVDAQRKQLVIMQQQAQEIKSMRGAGGIVAQPGRQFLNNLINTEARKNGLSNSLKTKAESNNKVRVSMDNVPFDNVMKWLDQLVSRNGIIVTKLTVDRQPSVGRVNVSVYLESP